MRILHFLPAYAPAWQYGGPILSVSRLCEGLVREGIDVRVITTNAGLPDLPHSQLGVTQYVNGVQVIYYPVDSQKGVIQSRALVSDLSSQIPWADLLHLSSIWQPLGLSVQMAAHYFRVPVLQTLRGALGPYSWRRSWWKKVPYYWLKEKPLLQNAAALHCTTKQEARELAWLRLKPPIALIPNPLDLQQLYCHPALAYQWKSRLDLESDQPLLLVVGRLHHKKGLDLLPKALALLADKPWQILFIGEDEDGTAPKLRNAFNNYGLSSRCHWLDFLPAGDLVGPYNTAHLLLLPSLHENFGNVVVEALACGSGVVVSTHVAVAEDIVDCPGVTILPRCPRLWAEKISLLLDKKRPGLYSESWIKERYGSRRISTKAIEIYRSLIPHA